MKNLFALVLVLLATVSARAEIIGNPFLPEEDARFDKLEKLNKATTNGLKEQLSARATYDFAVQGGSSTAHSLGVALPANATITRSYFYVKTVPVGAGSTMALSCGAANNIFSAAALTAKSVGDFVDGVSTGASTVFKDVGSSACNMTATIGTAPLTAGKLNVIVDYFVHD